MIRFLLISALKLLRQDLARSSLVILGVALASAVTIAVLIASEAALRSFREGAAATLSPAPLIIQAHGGRIETDKLTEILTLLEAEYDLELYLSAQGVISEKPEQLTEPLRQLPVKVLGIFSSRELDTVRTESSNPSLQPVYASSSLLSWVDMLEGRQLQLSVASERSASTASGTVGESTLPIKLIAAADNELPANTIILPLPVLQRLIGVSAVADSIGLYPKEKLPLPRLTAQRLNDALRQFGVRVTPREQLQNDGGQLLQAFRGNLLLLVGLTVGLVLFAVYAAALLSTESRRREFQILKTLGVSGRTIILMVLTEAGLLALGGALIGLTLGSPLVELISSTVLSTISQLYLPGSSFNELSLLSFYSLYLLIIGAALLVVVAGSLIPAYSISKVPSGVIEREQIEQEQKPSIALTLCGLVALLATALALSSQPHYLLSYTALLLMAASAALLAPTLLWLLSLGGSLALEKLLGKAHGSLLVSSLVALRRVSGSVRLYGLPVAAASVGVLLIVGINGMTHSFRAALTDWMNTRIKGDIYISRSGTESDGSNLGIPPVALNTLSAEQDGVTALQFSLFNGWVDDQLAVFAGSELSKALERGLYQLHQGEVSAADFSNQDSPAASTLNYKVLISESAARKLELEIGSQIDLFGATFQVAAIIVEYSTEAPLLLFDLSTLQALKPTAPITSIGIFIDPQLAPKNFAEQLNKRAEGFGLTVTSNTELRETILQIFDRTFEITRLIQWVIVAVCALGFLVIELQLLQRRKLDLTLLKIVGLSLAGTTLTITLEMLLMSLPALLLGISLGCWLAWALATIINPLSFGWSFPFLFSWGDALQPALALLTATACASLIPFLKAGVTRIRTVR